MRRKPRVAAIRSLLGCGLTVLMLLSGMVRAALALPLSQDAPVCPDTIGGRDLKRISGFFEDPARPLQKWHAQIDPTRGVVTLTWLTHVNGRPIWYATRPQALAADGTLETALYKQLPAPSEAAYSDEMVVGRVALRWSAGTPGNMGFAWRFDAEPQVSATTYSTCLSALSPFALSPVDLQQLGRWALADIDAQALRPEPGLLLGRAPAKARNSYELQTVVTTFDQAGEPVWLSASATLAEGGWPGSTEASRQSLHYVRGQARPDTTGDMVGAEPAAAGTLSFAAPGDLAAHTVRIPGSGSTAYVAPVTGQSILWQPGASIRYQRAAQTSLLDLTLDTTTCVNQSNPQQAVIMPGAGALTLRTVWGKPTCKATLRWSKASGERLFTQNGIDGGSELGSASSTTGTELVELTPSPGAYSFDIGLQQYSSYSISHLPYLTVVEPEDNEAPASGGSWNASSLSSLNFSSGGWNSTAPAHERCRDVDGSNIQIFRGDNIPLRWLMAGLLNPAGQSPGHAMQSLDVQRRVINNQEQWRISVHLPAADGTPTWLQTRWLAAIDGNRTFRGFLRRYTWNATTRMRNAGVPVGTILLSPTQFSGGIAHPNMGLGMRVRWNIQGDGLRSTPVSSTVAQHGAMGCAHPGHDEKLDAQGRVPANSSYAGVWAGIHSGTARAEDAMAVFRTGNEQTVEAHVLRFWDTAGNPLWLSASQQRDSLDLPAIEGPGSTSLPMSATLMTPQSASVQKLCVRPVLKAGNPLYLRREFNLPNVPWYSYGRVNFNLSGSSAVPEPTGNCSGLAALNPIVFAFPAVPENPDLLSTRLQGWGATYFSSLVVTPRLCTLNGNPGETCPIDMAWAGGTGLRIRRDNNNTGTVKILPVNGSTLTDVGRLRDDLSTTGSYCYSLINADNTVASHQACIVVRNNAVPPAPVSCARLALASTPAATACGSLTGLTTVATGTQIKFKLNIPTAEVTQLRITDDSGCHSPLLLNLNLGGQIGPMETPSFAACQMPGAYTFQVRTCGPTLICGDPVLVNLQVTGDITPPANLSAENLGDGAYALEWSTSGYAWDIYFEYGFHEGASAPVAPSQPQIGAVRPRLTGVRPGSGTYHFYARACRPNLPAAPICSGWSRAQPIVLTAPPDGVTAQPAAAGGLNYRLSWAYPAWGHPTGYFQHGYSATDVQAPTTVLPTSISPLFIEGSVPQVGTYYFFARACTAVQQCSSWRRSAAIALAGPQGNPEMPLPAVADPNFQIDADSSRTGSTRGEFRVDESGAATYSIAIMTVPGSGNMAPEMSLGYSSRGGGGPLGSGWQLGGQSVISRCGQTTEQGDAKSTPVRLTTEDRFCLDGQRLLLVSGQYGADGSVYHTEIDQLSRVTASGVVGSGLHAAPAQFIVERKDGTRSIYGSATGGDSTRIAAPVSGSVFAWPLARVRDSAGNFMSYEYRHGSDGIEFVLERVRYTGNDRAGTTPYAQIQFEYEALAAHEQTQGYVAGERLRTSLRLAAIRSRGEGDALIRRYQLVYGSDEAFGSLGLSSGRSILQAVSECHGETAADCLPATTFSWNAGSTSIPAGLQLLSASLPKFNSALPIDFNGDGLQDVLATLGDAGDAASFRVLIANRDASMTGSVATVAAACGTKIENLGQVQPIDLRGTGFQGIVYATGRCSVASSNGIYYHAWNGSTLEPAQKLADLPSGSGALLALERYEITVMDVDGDGMADLLIHFPGAGGTVGNGIWSPQSVRAPIWTYHNQDGALATPVRALGGFDWLADFPPGGCASGEPQYSFHLSLHKGTGAFSVDGGGRAAVLANAQVWVRCYDILPRPEGDVVVLTEDEQRGGGNLHTELLDERSRIFTIEPVGGDELLTSYADLQLTNAQDSIVPADVNGDGLTDFITVRNDTASSHCPQDYCAVSLQLNTGRGLAAKVEQFMVHKNVAPYVRMLDYNGDGAPDLLEPSAHDQASAYWKVHGWRWYGNGVGQFSPTGVAGPSAGKLTDGAQTLFLDRLGNGRNHQLLIRKDGSTWNLYSALAQFSDCSGVCYRNAHSIAKITDGLGAWTAIEYRSLAQRSVYTRDNGGPYLGMGRGAPVYDLIAPMYVVATATSLSPQVQLNANATASTDLPNGTASTRYYYTGAKLQAGGRGFLGFREVASFDPQNAILTRTRYGQVFPYAGMPEQTETSWQPAAPWPQVDNLAALSPCGSGQSCVNTAISSGTLLGRSINTYSQRNTVAGGVHAYLEQSESATYTPLTDETSGAITGSTFTQRVVTRNLAVDAYGNIGQVEVSTYSSPDDSALAARQLTVNTYANDETLWYLGRLRCSEVASSRPGTATLTRRSSFGYDAITGILNRETVQPASCTDPGSFETSTSYGLNLFGLHTTTTVQARDLPVSRVSRTAYDTLGRFASAEFVTLNGTELQTSEVLARDRYGNATQVRNGQGLIARAYFDSLGRPYYSYSPDGAWTRVLHSAGEHPWCPLGTALREETVAAQGSTGLVCKDKLGRETRQVSRAVDQQLVYADTRYDYASRPVETSEPYFAGQTSYFSRLVYDEFGRVEFTRLPDNSLQVMRYLPLETRTTNALGQVTRSLHNVLGETVQDIAADSGVTTYGYDALGRVLSTDGPLPGSIDRIEVGYSLAGQKIQLVDPDKGTWRYRHNGLGELLCQIDPKNQGKATSYDSLGRASLSYERAGVSDLQTCAGTQQGDSSWTYHNGPGQPTFGQLQAESYGYSEPALGTSMQTNVSYSYDSLGRLSSKDTTLIGGGEGVVSYTERATYDQFGRPFQAFDASGGFRGVRNVYGSYGHLVGLREASAGADGTLYWELLATDARGQPTHARLGNGIDVRATYEASTGRLRELVDAHSQQGLAQDLRMQWDAIGNLLNRRDAQRNQTEHFEYDSRNRLRKTFSQFGNGPQELRQEQQYDLAGNITFKSDVGSYSYSTSVRPHAVSAAGGIAYNYDASGNLISDGTGRTLSYNLSDQAVRIQKGLERSEFQYFHSGQRIIHRELSNNVLTARTHYIGSVEVYLPASGGKQFRRAIGGTAIVTVFENTGVSQVRYLHKDHLGSTTAISQESGQVISSSSFDPWGKRRDASVWHPWQAPSAANLAAMRAITPRGYTGHEHLDAVAIIHMNGRIYDANLGRFLQADTVIEDATTLNRYSYVHNNPMAYTDPTGHFSIGRILRTVAAIVVTVYTGGAAAGAWGFFGATLTTGQAFAAVVAAGAISGAITSGTIEGAAWGAFSGAVFFGIGQGLSNAGNWARGGFAGGLSKAGFAVKTISHGLAGGAISALQGGKFGHGFVSAAGSAATAPFMDVASTKGIWQGGVVTSLVGGTLSKLSGGKFANGAVTAAMSYAFNQVASSLRTQHPTEFDRAVAENWVDRSDELAASSLGDRTPEPGSVYVCRDPAFGNGLGVGAMHYWVRTAEYETGMGTPAAGADAGNRYDYALSAVESVSHFGRSLGSKAECLRAFGANAHIANRLMRPGRPLGYFAPPVNYCKTYAASVISASGGQWPNFSPWTTRSGYMPVKRTPL